ncbi:MAG: Jag N-terminal domain-containing protein [Selenomonadaceae bacterium]|nr:Jag N-terminal domain-containing protein [Selenomonadaceae bacterium]
MATTIEKTGKTIEDALRAALTELGVDESAVEYEVLEKPSKRLFGLLTGPARIRVTVKEAPKVVEPPKVEAEIEPKVEPKVEEPTVEQSIEPTVEDAKVEEPTPSVEPEPSVEPTVDDQTVEPIDEKAIEAATIERAKAFLSDILNRMKLKVELEGREAEEGYVLSITGSNLGILIGKHGQTLDALQFIVNLAANGQQNQRVHFVIDVEGYRQKRTESLKKIAKTFADRVIRTRKEVRLEPMSRYERKVIHLALQNNAKVTTHSAGNEPYRYVIISPTKAGS